MRLKVKMRRDAPLSYSLPAKAMRDTGEGMIGKASEIDKEMNIGLSNTVNRFVREASKRESGNLAKA